MLVLPLEQISASLIVQSLFFFSLAVSPFHGKSCSQSKQKPSRLFLLLPQMQEACTSPFKNKKCMLRTQAHP